MVGLNIDDGVCSSLNGVIRLVIMFGYCLLYSVCFYTVFQVKC